MQVQSPQGWCPDEERTGAQTHHGDAQGNGGRAESDAATQESGQSVLLRSLQVEQSLPTPDL